MLSIQDFIRSRKFNIMQQISHINFIDNVIDIRFKHGWYQEDIKQLLEIILVKLTSIKITEKQLGADRETYRLSIEQNYLTLNFDYYSQSCWLEPESIQNNISEYAHLLNN